MRRCLCQRRKTGSNTTKGINQLKQIRNAIKEEKEGETLQLEKEKKQETMLVEKEKERKVMMAEMEKDQDLPLEL